MLRSGAKQHKSPCPAEVEPRKSMACNKGTDEKSAGKVLGASGITSGDEVKKQRSC